MSKRSADITVAGTVCCSLVLLVLARFAVDQKIFWWVAGMLVGAALWLGLRYTLYRIFGVWFPGRGTTPVRQGLRVMFTYSGDIAGAWLSGTIASVLVRYPSQVSWQLFLDLIPTPIWMLGLMALFAVVGAGFVWVLEPRKFLP